MSVTSVVELRPAEPTDAMFIDALLLADAQTRLSAVDVSVRAELAALQVHARRASYAQAYPRAHDHVIVASTERVGRLLLDDQSQSLHIVDFRIAADHRGRGLGTAVLTQLCERASARRQAIELQVDPNNPATHLYTRLGFAEASSNSNPAFSLWRRTGHLDA